MSASAPTAISSAKTTALAVLAALGCWLTCVSTSDAAWTAPTRIASSRVWSYSRPVLALDGAGVGVGALLWHREETLNETLNAVEASTRAGSAWGPPVVLSPPRASQAAYSPEVAMDDRGQATAVWDTISRVQYATSRGGEDFARADTLSGPGAGAVEPQIAVDPRGDATVVYESEGGLWILVRHTGGGWRALSRITGASSLGISEPQVARDSHGETILAWVRGSGANGEPAQVQAVVLGANDKPRFRPQTLFSARNLNIGELHLAVDESGDAVLAWHQKAKGGPVMIEAATRSADARFGRPLTVSRQKDADEVSVALDARGFAAILFTHILSTQPGRPEESEAVTPIYTQTAAIEVTTHLPGRRWSRPSKLAPRASGSTSEPRVTSEPHGNELMAVWTHAPFRSYEFSTYYGEIEASAVSPGESWQTPAVVSGANGIAPTLAVTVDGNATAAWVSASESSNTIETADYKPS
jgi:hypothetical protein